jgi:flagellar motor protein MotB
MMDSLDVAPDEHHVEADENYFVSMTDMMVGVLFVFIILLMVFALNFRSQTDISQERIQQLREAARTARQIADEVTSQQAEIEDKIRKLNEADRVRAEILQKISDELKAQGLSVKVDEVNGVIRLGENAVNFEVNSADLSAKAQTNVAKIANVLADVLPQYTSGVKNLPAYIDTIFIEGHTDTTGIDNRNWTLSTERAVNTYRYLIEIDPSLRQLHNHNGKEIFSVSGYSSTRPVPGYDVNDYQVHRRIDLRFVMDVADKDRLKSVLELSHSVKSRLDDLQKAVHDVDTGQ